MPAQKKNLDTQLQPQKAAGFSACSAVWSMPRVMVLVRSAGMNGTVSGYRRIPHLGTRQTTLFLRSALRITAIPFKRAQGTFLGTNTGHKLQNTIRKKRGAGSILPPLHP
jgi:hypothetical protein